MPPLIRLSALSLLSPVLCLASTAAAVPVTFDTNVLASCVLSLGTGGALGTSSDGGTKIGSEETGGAAAGITVISTGGRPTITVGAPTLSQKPGAYAGSPTVSVRYTSTGGANQPYTSGSTSYTSTNLLGDTLTINARAVDSDGFAAGSYRIQTQVTCQQ